MTTNELGYRVALVTYIVLLGLDTLRPGFVSSAFSVHVLVIPILVFAWAWSREASHHWVWFDVPTALGFAFLAACMVWVRGEAFGDMRLLLTLGVALLPLFALQGNHRS